MRLKFVIIIGIVVIILTPFITISGFQSYENYLQQLDYEKQRIANEPKPGERSYIEPELKAKLEEIELDLRNKVAQLHEGLPPSSYAVNLNLQTKEIEAFIENEKLIPLVKEYATKYPNDVTVIVEYGGISLTIPTDLKSQQCADLYDKIHQDFKDTPCNCCNPEPGQPVCEPKQFDSILASNVEFRDSLCEFNYTEWIHLTKDKSSAKFNMSPHHFSIDMFKTNLSEEIPIGVSYSGYDKCMTFKVKIYEHGGNRTLVAERFYENVCSYNQQKEYRLPLHNFQLTDYNDPIILPKGNYKMILLYEQDDKLQEVKHSQGQFFFSSHFEAEKPISDQGYDFTQPSSIVARDVKCADWYEKIIQTGKDLESENGLLYELRETNVFRDLDCASVVSEWKSLTNNDVDFIPWDKVIEN